MLGTHTQDVQGISAGDPHTGCPGLVLGTHTEDVQGMNARGSTHTGCPGYCPRLCCWGWAPGVHAAGAGHLVSMLLGLGTWCPCCWGWAPGVHAAGAGHLASIVTVCKFTSLTVEKLLVVMVRVTYYGVFVLFLRDVHA